ncbi:MAG: hypothetical protein IPO86_06715 [Saprospiraceae bacterium]|nr:hypothetical protein [Saprospiraceae bacterium]
MNRFLKIFAALLLLFNGLGAIYGGWNLMLHPDGSSIQLSMEWLKYSNFENYFIPGLVLFIANGVFSLLAFMVLVLNLKNFHWLIILQGVILCGWIFIQILLIQNVYFLHYIMVGVGIFLIGIGYLLSRKDETV